MNQPKELRPSEVVWAYWAEVLSLEEDSIRLEIEYIKEAA